MALPIVVRRAGYRSAYRVLQLLWLVRRPALQGVKCLITDGDRVLLVRHTYGNRAWDLPGGALRKDELPVDAARREMDEELSIHNADWRDIGRLAEIVHHRRDTLYCFHAEVSDPQLTLDLGELATARWFSRASLPYDLAPHVLAIVARTVVRHRDPGAPDTPPDGPDARPAQG